MVHFNEMVSAKLRNYVYALADPRVTGDLRARVFYIGRGKGNRCFNHAAEELGSADASLSETDLKLSRIREIRESGAAVEVIIIKHALSEKDAKDLETVLIPLLGLTNKRGGDGADNSWCSIANIREKYDHPIERRAHPELSRRLLIVSLHKQNLGDLRENPNQMARATLGDWTLAEWRSRRVDMIIGVKNGVVVSVFRTSKDAAGKARFNRPSVPKGKKGRSRFQGTRAHALEALLRDRTLHHDGMTISKVRTQHGWKDYLPL